VQQRGHTDVGTSTDVAFGIDPRTLMLFDASGLRI
jgi:hypothetical protein